MASVDRDFDNKAEWNQNTEATFIHICHDHLKNGELLNSTFNKKSWAAIEQQMLAQCRIRFSVAQLKSKFNRLRVKYHQFVNLINHTGFSWDAEAQTVTASEEVWAEYFKKVPVAKQFRKKGLQHYDLLSDLFNSSIAIGRWHFSSSMPLFNGDKVATSTNDFNTPINADETGDNEDNINRPVSDAQNKGKKPISSSGLHSTPLYRHVDDCLSIATDEFINKRKEKRQKKSHLSDEVSSEQFTLQRCFDEVHKLPDFSNLPNETYIKFVKLIMEQPEWRMVFILMDPERRRPWLDSL